ncbi:MAG: MFS transporter [Boseongicola sp.]|nr:MAG: MFS transporter [Boseongicola sp.]
MDRAEIVHQNFLRRTKVGDLPQMADIASDLSPFAAMEIYRAQVLSRALDRQSRVMQKAGQGYYTIGASGHEGMAAVALATRPSDPAFLHYRDAAFQIARAGQVPGQTPGWDLLLSFACAVEDPISGGRHKVLGSYDLMIPPQTSTIASHLPKALGAAYSQGVARRHVPEHRVFDPDAIVICSFGDASANHSTAQGALNAAGWASVQGTPLPLLFICEDNGIGISVKTPNGWIEATMKHRPGVKYFAADGLDMVDTYRVAKEASDYVRQQRKPAFLHLSMVRLYGHAGADVATSYLSRAEVERDEDNDPLLKSASRLQSGGIASVDEAMRFYVETELRVARQAAEVVKRPRLQTADEVMATIVPPVRTCRPSNGPDPERRRALLGADAASDAPQTMSKCLNMAMTDLMLEHTEVVLMGEDVGKKGGVYGVTQKLQARFGPDRVIDTLLDETSILGLGIGMGQNGFVPIPEIQFLAYLHNAEDQLRGEAATLPFFSQGKFTNPMVIRVAGLGYQKGFGGHFHNDNSLAVLRDIPGLIIACPSNGCDAALMLREAVRLTREEQRVVVFVEPIALYNHRDLFEDGDAGWMTAYPHDNERIGLDEIGVHGRGRDLAIVTYGNGHMLSRKAAKVLDEKHGVATRVIDLRWLAPLAEDRLIEALDGVDSVLIVDECRRTGGQAEALMALMTERGIGRFGRHTAEDSFIATGPAFAATLPRTDTIVDAALELVRRKS